MFWIGFARYSVIFASALEVPPVIVSPVINFCCEDMYIWLLRESSTRTVAVAFDVPPVMVSPFVNWPALASRTPAPLSVNSLSPSSNKINSKVFVSCLM